MLVYAQDGYSGRHCGENYLLREGDAGDGVGGEVVHGGRGDVQGDDDLRGDAQGDDGQRDNVDGRGHHASVHAAHDVQPARVDDRDGHCFRHDDLHDDGVHDDCAHCHRGHCDVHDDHAYGVGPSLQWQAVHLSD